MTQESAPQLDHGFRRVLGPFSAMSVVIGAIVGIGIFFTPKAVADSAGSESLALLAWILGGLIALVGALTFAELGSLYSRTAGQYEILRDAYGPFVGFVYVFCNATIVQAGAIAIIGYYTALNLGLGLGVGGPSGPTHFWNLSIATIMILGLTAANLIGVRWGAAVQNLTVITKILTLLAITAVACFYRPVANDVADLAANATSGETGLSWTFLTAITTTLFAFGGWQQALWVGGEIRDPQRNVPRAIIFGVLVVIATYLAVNWAYLHLLGYSAMLQSPSLAVDAVAKVSPNWGGRAVGLAIALSGFGVLNAQLLTGPRLICGMARDGKFFPVFGRIPEKWGTPVAAILLLGGLGLGLLLGMELLAPLVRWIENTVSTTPHAAESLKRGVDYIDSLTNGVILVDSVLFLLTGLALIVLRRKFLAAPEAIRMPWFPLIPALFALGELAVLVGAFMNRKYTDGALIGVAWLAVGALIYLLRFRRK